jgi:hypothetical protein
MSFHVYPIVVGVQVMGLKGATLLVAGAPDVLVSVNPGDEVRGKEMPSPAWLPPSFLHDHGFLRGPTLGDEEIPVGQSLGGQLEFDGELVGPSKCALLIVRPRVDGGVPILGAGCGRSLVDGPGAANQDGMDHFASEEASLARRGFEVRRILPEFLVERLPPVFPGRPALDELAGGCGNGS